jgi:hypothetical protein
LPRRRRPRLTGARSAASGSSRPGRSAAPCTRHRSAWVPSLRRCPRH